MEIDFIVKNITLGKQLLSKTLFDKLFFFKYAQSLSTQLKPKMYLLQTISKHFHENRTPHQRSQCSEAEQKLPD